MKKNEKYKGRTINAANVNSVGGFLDGEHIIVIPPNQRPYSWGTEHVNDFITDIKNCYKKSNGEEYTHYFNMITYVRVNNKFPDEKTVNNKVLEIHDGQQRTTSSFLTLLYLHHKFIMKNQNSELKNIINSENIQNFENALYFEKNGIKKRKLHMFSYNDLLLDEIYKNLYKESMLSTITSMVNEESSLNYSSNKKIIHLLHEIDKVEDSSEILSMFNSLYNNFEIVEGNLIEEKQAYKIFELVNNRGKKLDDIDLVKNYFYQIADDSGCKSDLDEMTQMFQTLISELGDNFEDAFIKHWLLFYNKSTNVNYGKSNKIYDSVFYNLEGKGVNLSTPEIRDFVFKFMREMTENIEVIKNIYYLLSLKYEELFTENKKYTEVIYKIEDMGIQLERIKKMLKKRMVIKKEFEYTDYFAYYILYVHQKKKGALKNIEEEYSKVIAFYLYRSVVKSGEKILLDKLNYKLGYRLSILNQNDIDLNELFVGFLNEEQSETINYSNEFSEAIAKPIDFKGNKLKMLFYFLSDEQSRHRFFVEDKHGKYDLLEEEHIIPQASKRKGEYKYDEFNMTSLESKYKTRIEWIGNKMLLPREVNNEVSLYFPNKVHAYLKQDIDVFKEYYCILAEHFLGKKFSGPNDEALFSHKSESHENMIIEKWKNNSSLENEAIMIKVENDWRDKISKLVLETDALKLEAWRRLEEKNV